MIIIASAYTEILLNIRKNNYANVDFGYKNMYTVFFLIYKTFTDLSRANACIMCRRSLVWHSPRTAHRACNTMRV